MSDIDAEIRLMERWDELSNAVDRVLTSLPEQISINAIELGRQQKLMRNDMLLFFRRPRP